MEIETILANHAYINIEDYLSSFILIFLILINFSSFADEEQSNIDDFWKSQESQNEQNWKNLDKKIENIWREEERRVKKLWKDSKVSTEKKWILYKSDMQSRANFDFENGSLEVEVLIPKKEKDIMNARERVKKHLSFVESKISWDKGKNLFSGQFELKNKKAVTKNNIKKFFNELISDVKISRNPIQGADGKIRYKAYVKKMMVTNHTWNRAQKYYPEVKRVSAKLKVQPEVILAIIHTESHFNPYARSHAGAYGLMQIIPRFAGKEAYRYLYGKTKKLSKEYLYNPENNIAIGTTYFKILNSKYFSHIEDRMKNLYASVCAYNWGPTAVKNKILKKINSKNISSKELYDTFLARTPKETRDYLQRVVARSREYSKLVNL